MRLLKLISTVIALLIVVGVIAAACLVMFVDPNKLKPVLAQEVMKKTGYQLVINGNLTWSFYPHLGIRINQMSLKDPNKTETLLDLQDVRIASRFSELWKEGNYLKGRVYASNMRIANLNANDVEVDLHWKNDVLSLNNIKASLYQGNMEGKAQIKVLANTPYFEWDVTLNKIQLHSFLQDLNGNETTINISGIGQVSIVASTQGKNREELLTHLNGRSEFKLNNGAIHGINLNNMVLTADALLRKQPVNIPTEPAGQTVFDNLDGSVTITEGIVTSNHLILTAPAFVVTGEGNLGLNAKTLDLALQIKPHQVNNMNPWMIPVLIQGDLNHPDVRLNMSEIRKRLFRQEIDKVKLKAREMIKEHFPGKAGSFLENLLSSR